MNVKQLLAGMAEFLKTAVERLDSIDGRTARLVRENEDLRRKLANLEWQVANLAAGEFGVWETQTLQEMAAGHAPAQAPKYEVTT